MQKRAKNGFMLGEALTAVTVLLILLSLVTIPAMLRYREKQGIVRAAQDLILAIRRVQQSSMYGYEREKIAMTQLFIEKDGYRHMQGSRLIGEKKYFPAGVENRNNVTIIVFHGNGLPSGDTTMTLVDRKNGRRCTIYIAIQTGRVRFESI